MYMGVFEPSSTPLSEQELLGFETSAQMLCKQVGVEQPWWAVLRDRVYGSGRGEDGSRIIATNLRITETGTGGGRLS